MKVEILSKFDRDLEEILDLQFAGPFLK